MKIEECLEVQIQRTEAVIRTTKPDVGERVQVQRVRGGMYHDIRIRRNAISRRLNRHIPDRQLQVKRSVCQGSRRWIRNIREIRSNRRYLLPRTTAGINIRPVLS